MWPATPSPNPSRPKILERASKLLLAFGPFVFDGGKRLGQQVQPNLARLEFDSVDAADVVVGCGHGQSLRLLIHAKLAE